MALKTNKNDEQRYCKEQLVKSGKFPKDLAVAVLKDDREYTAEEAAKAILDYYEREVR